MAGKTWISPFSTPFLISLSNVRAQQFIDIDSGTLFALESIFQFKDALAQGAPFVREEGEEIFCSNETFSFPFCYETLEQREEGRRNVFHRG